METMVTVFYVMLSHVGISHAEEKFAKRLQGYVYETVSCGVIK